MALAKVLRIQAAFERRGGITVGNRKISSGGSVAGVKINLRLTGVKDISSVEAAAQTAENRVLRFADKDDKDDSSSGEVSAADAVNAVKLLASRIEMLGVVADADQSAAKDEPTKETSTPTETGGVEEDQNAE